MTGKPALINESKILESNPPFEPTCMYVTEDKIWFSVRRINALLCMDKDNWELEFAGSFPGEDDYITNVNNSLYRNPVEHNGKMYFPPFLAKEIAVYSHKDMSFEKLKYQDGDDSQSTERAFLGAISYNNSIFFTPYIYPAIIRLNTNTNKLTHYTDWLELRSELTGKISGCCFGFPFLLNNSIWLASQEENTILEFNAKTCSSTVYEVGKKGNKYSNMCFDGEYFWITPRMDSKTPLIKWNPQSNETKEFPDIFIDNDVRGYISPVYHNGYVQLLPVSIGKSFKIDIKTDAITVSDEFTIEHVENHANRTSMAYISVQIFNDNIFVFNRQNNCLIKSNTITGELKEERIKYSSEASTRLEHFYSLSFLSSIESIKTFLDCYYHENEHTGLCTFLTYITGHYHKDEATLQRHRQEIAQSLNAVADNTTGKSIYNHIVNLFL